MLTLKKLIHTALDILYPWYCFGCQKRGEMLCDKCLNQLDPSIKALDEEKNIWYLLDYKNKVVKNLISHLKYRQVEAISHILGQCLAEAILELIADQPELLAYSKTKKIILIPVPMHPKKQRQRGFNQAELLALEIEKIIKETENNTEIVKKIIPTKNQVACKNKKERKINIKDSFVVEKPEVIKQKVVIIIDDVITTGATVGEIRRIISKYEPLEIITLAVAHG